MAIPPSSEFPPPEEEPLSRMYSHIRKRKRLTDAVLAGSEGGKSVKEIIETEAATETIALNAARIRSAANKLADRIAAFEAYLTDLPGRIETVHYGPHPDADCPASKSELSLVLRLHRQGRGWVLSVGSHTIQQNDFGGMPVDYSLLKDAPLRLKIAAIKMFPDLLNSMTKTQDRLIKEVKEVADEFDTFLASLPPNKKEGK